MLLGNLVRTRDVYTKTVNPNPTAIDNIHRMHYVLEDETQRDDRKRYAALICTVHAVSHVSAYVLDGISFHLCRRITHTRAHTHTYICIHENFIFNHRARIARRRHVHAYGELARVTRSMRASTRTIRPRLPYRISIYLRLGAGSNERPRPNLAVTRKIKCFSQFIAGFKA